MYEIFPPAVDIIPKIVKTEHYYGVNVVFFKQMVGAGSSHMAAEVSLTSQHMGETCLCPPPPLPHLVYLTPLLLHLLRGP